MTVSSTIIRNDYVSDGSTTTFPYTFRIFDADDLLVTVRDLAGVETTLQRGDDYTVTGVGSDDGGDVEMNEAPATGHSIAIRLQVPLLQETSIRNQGAFFPSIHEDAFDRFTMMALQQQDLLDRSIKLGETDADTASVRLPSPVANEVIAWNDAADGLVSLSPSDIATIASAGNFLLDRFEEGTDFTEGVTTNLGLSGNPGTINNTQVFFDGEYQDKGTYSIDGDVLTFNDPIPAGVSVIEVVHAGALEVSFPADNSVRTDAIQNLAVIEGKIANGAVAQAKLASGSVSGAKIDATDGTALRTALGLGTSAVLDAGTAIGDVPQLVDDGSSNATLPAVRGDNLTDIPVAGVTGAQKALQVMVVVDERAEGTDGGGMTSGEWRTRVLNETKVNGISGASLSSDTITLPAGTYLIVASAPGRDINVHKARLNINSGSSFVYGTSEISSAGSHTTRSVVHTRQTFATSATISLEHRSSGSSASNGRGIATNFGPETYALVQIVKLD